MKKKTKITLAILGIVLILAVILGILFFREFYPSVPALGDATSGAIRVACVGDSITQGVGVEDAEHNAYPAQLQALLGDGYQVLNYGLSGRSLQSDAMLSYTKERFFTISQEAQPDIVLIMLGTNDTLPINWNADKYEHDLEAFVKIYQNLDSAPTVYLMRCPPIYSTNIAHDPAVLSGSVLPIIERVAAKTGVQTIDIFGALSNHAEMFPDGLHPNAEGAAVIAETVYGHLREH